MASKRKRLAQRRKIVGHTQESLAHKLEVDRTTVVRWERGETEPQPWFRQRLAAALDVSLTELEDLISDAVHAVPDKIPPVASGVTVEIDEGGATLDRRRFTVNTALAALGIAAPLPDWLTSPDVPARIGSDHLRMITAIIDRFEQGDAAIGGDLFCDMAITVHAQICSWLRHSAYSRTVGDGLQNAVGDLEAWIGWLALDAERRDVSRRYLHEAILRARVRDDPRLEVRAMASLALLLVREPDPHESRQCAEAAHRIAASWATPRLATLLHLRTARACAAAGDVSGFSSALARARTEMDRGSSEEDPSYIRFVTPLELTGIEGLSHLALGRPDRAVSAFRRIVDTPDPTYRRNHGYYTLKLADAYHRRGDISGASETALAALPLTDGLRSRRVTEIFRTLRTELGAHVSRVSRAAEFTAAYDRAVRS
ncbi:helix-turn-helix domain-containing protein [Plantactinospora endophytica]|uniref:HTH cro/C1-type domain-containing protein n=1 Tax=Plantactinospora endophytica TaxID=673535 RepID=A0ABQ4E1Y7_9ACTN|nr:helix-turn-helix transcriptional regulator [Plantactinospora endophytica]GIG88729.1 hypothetical protein Pen02_36650 [Plantactinospora endophytica]